MGGVAKPYFGVGIGQSWADYSGSRVKATSYQNTTGKPILVSIRVPASGAGKTSSIDVSSNNAGWIVAQKCGQEMDEKTLSAVVPANHYYRLTMSGAGDAPTAWAELR